MQVIVSTFKTIISSYNDEDIIEVIQPSPKPKEGSLETEKTDIHENLVININKNFISNRR